MTSDKPLRLAIFDCDGTLVDSERIIVEAMNTAFRASGLPEAEGEAIRRVVGLSLEEAVAGVLPPDARDPALVYNVAEEYKRSFSQLRLDPMHTEPLFPGCLEALDLLTEQGFLLAVATGKSRKGLDNTLKLHNLSDRFLSLQTADFAAGKPHPEMIHNALADCGADPANCVMIGDTSYDIQMAQNAGTRSVAVSWGYHPPEELMALGATALARSWREIPALVADLTL